MRFAYYAGCSLQGTAREYDVSTRAVCSALGIDLEEVPDWNCCGATSAHSIDRKLAQLLPARNLKIIEGQKLDVIIPCAACFARTMACAYTLDHNASARSEIEHTLNYTFKRNVKIYHLMELLARKIGREKIQEHIKCTFGGLRVVCYYGCLLVRPHEVTRLDDRENPQFLDEIISATGIETIDWPYKTECCGGALSLSRGDLVIKLVDRMIGWAEEAGADAVVTACPLCHSNLEMRQGRNRNFPVFYFTELLALSFDRKEVKDTLKKHLIDVSKVLKRVQIKE